MRWLMIGFALLGGAVVHLGCGNGEEATSGDQRDDDRPRRRTRRGDGEGDREATASREQYGPGRRSTYWAKPAGIWSPRSGANRAQCLNNLKRIALAMHNYHMAHRSFPPAYTTDAEGRRLHSWRVLLLPYMEHKDLYDRIRLDEPWDSPHNLRFADDMPEVYRCPEDDDAARGETSYVLIVGPDEASRRNPRQAPLFVGSGKARVEDVLDGTSNTLMVVECASSGINWMAPYDLESEKMTFRIDDGSRPGIRSNHPDGANVALVDGSVRLLKESIDEQLVKALITASGLEVIDSDDLR